MTQQQHPSRTVIPEHRWPVVVTILAALALYAALPSEVLGWQRYLVAGVGGALLIPLIAANPRRFTRYSRSLRSLSVGFALLLVAVNQVMLVRLVILLVDGESDGHALLLGALQVWLVNVIGYATLLWELDRGGPVVRTMRAQSEVPPTELRFPQDDMTATLCSELDDQMLENPRTPAQLTDWTPRFTDYLYSAFSNSMAFSATDSLPLSGRFKLLLALQAFGGFTILALVIARSVNILS
ncbi:MAG: hypothetical protein B5766_06520 [Candidatus Lumbricidophila eiseniae]|uniref:DUF1345 domain-containing protein n=1 Tax=Candidatus Lumbricidiphila eiseniae TaxID=1969409 RepID=A0A2A6FRG0_9MICO|nr:MAG: hypothetical protein B5766_06520 [Candidatus Lumbricidophila eiseniae]